MILVAQVNSRIICATLIPMSTPSQVNLAKLSATLRTKRGDKGLRAVAEEIGGVSASTLSRIEQGNVPDLDTFMKICRWLRVPPDEFGSSGKQTTFSAAVAPNATDTSQLIEAHFRAEKILPPDTIAALSEMIRLAYKAANEGKLGKPTR